MIKVVLSISLALISCCESFQGKLLHSSMARLLTSKEMKRRAAGLEPFDEEELTRVCGGLEALAGDINAEVNWEQLRSFVKAHAHDP